ncbi:MAG: lectin-like protein [Acidobacteriota bacterium]
MFSQLSRVARVWAVLFVLCALAQPAVAKGLADTEPVPEPGGEPERVVTGLSTLYTFLEGQGTTVHDVAPSEGNRPGLDLDILRPNSVLWLPSGGLSIVEPTVIQSSQSADRLVDGIVDSGALTVEAWVRPASPFQDGPAAIVSLSASSRERNFALAQDAAVGGEKLETGATSVPGRYASWLRTTQSTEDGRPEVGAVGGVTADLTHVAMTRNEAGQTLIYVDGEIRGEGLQRGSLKAWSDGVPLFLANEKDEQSPWLGDLHLVAVYRRALSSGEVNQNFLAGPPEAPEPPPLPYLEISPSPSMLVELGDRVELSARWVVPPGGEPSPLPEPRVRWTSSNLERATVTADGVVTVHMERGMALITAVADDAPPHRAGVASMIAGAKLSSDLRQFDADLVQSLDLAHEGDSAILTLDVDRTPGTAQIEAGMLVAFGSTASVWVDSVESVSGAFRIRGAPPAVNEVFTDVDVDLDSGALETVAAAMSTARRGGLGALKAAGASPNPCHFSLNFSVDPHGRFKLKTQNGKVVLFDFFAKLFVDMDAPGQRFGTRLRCAEELKPRLPFIYFAFGPVWSVYGSAYALVGADLTWDVGSSHVEVDGPEFQVGVEPEGGIHWDPQSGYETGADFPEPTTDFSPPAMIGEPSDVALDYFARGFVEFGTRLSVAVGGLPPDPMGSTDAFEVGRAYAMVSQLSVGGSGRLPLAVVHGFDDERYVNPEVETFLRLDLFLVKEVDVGTLIGLMFDVLGLPRPSFEFNPLVSVKAFHEMAPPGLENSEHPIYVDGGIHYPGNTVLTIDGKIDESETRLYGEADLEIWRRRAVPGEKFQLFSPVNPTYWAPTSEDVGEWEYRAVKRYPTFFGNWISPAAPVEVLPTSNIKLSPVDPELVVPVGSSATLELAALNDGDSIENYILSLPDNPFWFDVHPLGLVIIDPDETKFHTVAVDCTDGTRVEPRWVDIHMQLVEDSTVYRHRVWAGCQSLVLEPDEIRFKGQVLDPPVWMRKHMTLTNHADAPVEWQIELGQDLPFVVDPPTGTLGAGESREIELRYRCTAAGEETRDAFLVAPDTGERVPYTVALECSDKGGTTWGDPHLITHDGLVYDFHGKGEFVLTRDPSRDFEVQVRQQGSWRIAYNKAIAMKVGGQTVTFYLTPPSGQGPFNVDGAATALADGSTLELAGGGEVTRRGLTYTVQWPGETSYAKVSQRGWYYSLFVHPDRSYAGTLEGLLGDSDGDPLNDIALRDGTPIDAPPSFAELYDCDSTRCLAYDDPHGWLIRTPTSGPAESLFAYEPGQGPEDFAPGAGTMDPEAPVDLAEFDPELVAYAQAQCTAAGIVDPDLLMACILDIVVTGVVEVGLETAEQTVPPAPAGEEVCDGLDNDLDGAVDGSPTDDDVCQCSDRTDGSLRRVSLCRTRVSWTAARSACLARGQDLIKTDTPAEHQWLQDWVSTVSWTNPWIGLSNRGVEDRWIWPDGRPVGWETWGVGQPTGGHEECVQHVRLDGSWNDLRCSTLQAFVCGSGD